MYLQCIYIYIYIHIWLVVSIIFYFSIQLGISSSQLTNSIIFQRGETTNHRIGLWEILQENPIFDGKNHGFL